MDDNQMKSTIAAVESKVLAIRGREVIIDRDVADIYGVSTRDINKAVKNNPRKFPQGYIMELSQQEKQELVENFHRFEPLKHSTALPHAFTERGLYMLATIMKGDVATDATLAIVETFAKVRELARAIEAANDGHQPDQSRLQRMITEVFADTLPVTMRKTTFAINAGILRFTVETTREKE